MDDELLAQEMGALIRQLRVAAGMSQEEFADRCALHRTYVGAIERGEKAITVETAHKVVKALGLSMSQFFRRLENQTK